MESEKRLYPRLSRKLPIKIADAGFADVIYTKDISPSGLYIETTSVIPLMTRVNITLVLPFAEGGEKTERHVELNGTVVRSNLITREGGSFYETAIFFDDISEKNKLLLTEFIENSPKEN